MSDSAIVGDDPSNRETSTRRPDGPAAEQNRLLRRLSAQSYAQLSADFESLRVGVMHSVWEPNEPLRWVYFPRDCVISLVVNFSEGRPVEATTIGCEGFAGVHLALGAESSSTQAYGQVPGEAVRLTAARFREALARDGELAQVVRLYAQYVYEQTAQATACNRKHVTLARCARWLLMTHDRVGRDQFELTHEFLATMLGVRRASVSEAAESLRRARVIRYSRGKITVLERAGLEEAACECYRVVNERYDHLLGPAS